MRLLFGATTGVPPTVRLIGIPARAAGVMAGTEPVKSVDLLGNKS